LKSKKVVQGFYRFPCFAVSEGRRNPLLEQPEEIGTEFDSLYCLSGGFLSSVFKKIEEMLWSSFAGLSIK
jgi:hypothetical protein